MQPEGWKGSWQEFAPAPEKLVCARVQAGRREFLITSSIQLATALSFAAQVLIAREVLHAILGARSFSAVLPWLISIIAITILLDFAGQSRTSRAACWGSSSVAERSIASSTSPPRLTCSISRTPDFHDRLRRAQMQGQFRALPDR